MRIPRIYTSQELSKGSHITLEEQASRHLAKVLRLQVDHPIIAFNGHGGEYHGLICAVGKKHIEVELIDFIDKDLCSALQSHIVIALSKGDKMELIVQKCTELGVNSIQPIITERCDVKINEQRWAKKRQQWQQIAISACEQSGRNQLPTIHAQLTFSQWLNHTPLEHCFIFHPNACSTMSQVKEIHQCTLVFGSEGGFSDAEMHQAAAKGLTSMSLGPRILRAETAPIAGLAMAQMLWGDL